MARSTDEACCSTDDMFYRWHVVLQMKHAVLQMKHVNLQMKYVLQMACCSTDGMLFYR